MSERDDRPDAHLWQGLLLRIFARFFPPPPIRPWELYTRQEVIRRLKIGENTFSQWVKLGLRVAKSPTAKGQTAAMYLLGRDIIRFLRRKDGQ